MKIPNPGLGLGLEISRTLDPAAKYKPNLEEEY
jgi:hypothetical protein